MTSNGYENQLSGKMHTGEPEAYKLFIGQVPKTWTEKELRPFFEPYGEIYDLTILHDKFTGQHKGCAFLTYYKKDSALNAQKELHDKTKLPGMPNFLQVKPADSETKAEDRKLFIGMISKRSTEEDLRLMFAPFGQIEECTVLRNPDGTSKACAFVKFSTRLQAQNAVKTMHNCKTMEGCSSPIVVKPADTEKDKLQKRMQSVASNLVSLGISLQMQQAAAGAAGVPGMPGAVPGLGGANAAYYQQLIQQAASGGADNNMLAQILAQAGAGGMNPAITNMLPGTNLSALGLNGAVPGAMGAMVAAAAMAGQGNAQGQASPNHIAAAQSQHQQLAAANASLFSTPNSNGQLNPTSAITNSVASNTYLQNSPGMNPMALQSMQTLAAAFPHAYAATMFPQQNQQIAQRVPQKEGPDGSNLFVYHLPQEYGDADLQQTFMPFGNVVSAKVFIDKATSFSKCFGFVSYDNANSAQAAINAMNGFSIGSKRLKVQLKRPKEQSRPY